MKSADWTEIATKIVDELEAEMPVREAWEVLKMAEMTLAARQKADLAARAQKLLDELTPPKGEFLVGGAAMILNQATREARRRERMHRRHLNEGDSNESD